MNKLLEKGRLSSIIPTFSIQDPQSTIEMREPTTDSSAVAYAVELLSRYGFELRGYTAQELVNLWLKTYQANWIRLAVIEALYQGRYKAVSVEQILTVWIRRGQPIYRFNHEFERLISRKLPQNLTAPITVSVTPQTQEYGLPLLPPSASNTSGEEAAQPATIECETSELESRAEPEYLSPTPQITEDVKEEPIQPDKQPIEVSISHQTRLVHDANWSRYETSKQPIHQFIPPPDSSDFYLKLKAVVEQEDSISPAMEASVTDDEVELECLDSKED
ncbi:MAG TPA: hypothetical protein V6C95_12305 [Coleofasciculaceae cyanobacterium]